MYPQHQLHVPVHMNANAIARAQYRLCAVWDVPYRLSKEGAACREAASWAGEGSGDSSSRRLSGSRLMYITTACTSCITCAPDMSDYIICLNAWISCFTSQTKHNAL